jgi:acyl-CoA thioesterase FadM
MADTPSLRRQDTFQHLNNVHAFRHFETGRMQFVRSLLPELPPNSEPSLLQGKPGGVGVILASIGAKYRVRCLFWRDLL